MVKIPEEMQQAFYARTRSAAVPLVLNDAVQIVAGPFRGSRGAVISIASVTPTLRVLVELGDGSDVTVEATDLRLLHDP